MLKASSRESCRPGARELGISESNSATRWKAVLFERGDECLHISAQSCFQSIGGSERSSEALRDCTLCCLIRVARRPATVIIAKCEVLLNPEVCGVAVSPWRALIRSARALLTSVVYRDLRAHRMASRLKLDGAGWAGPDGAGG